MAAAADRHLLFGLLALQVGMIDQGQLIVAFQAWTRDKTRGIADHLAARGAIDADQRSLLEALAAQHLHKHGGDAEKSLASLAVGRTTREAIKEVGDPEVDATLGHVGSASTENADHELTATYSIGSSTSDGQRFRVLRPHARGGLGAVFVALDAELNREVALKQILDHHADDPTSRTRFVLEAEITGGLEHPGIVPVYGLGSYGDGRPYYAMRFVRGESLKDAIAAFHGDDSLKDDPGKRSLALRKLLRRFVDVCNAIDYAHTRGVLHRDIKPANVIVGKHGETLVVDWGLAKVVGRSEHDSLAGERTLIPSSASGSAETLPGSALGTPSYMSPEQASGDLDRLGPRSDVYSLGATLYCLLTGRPPFKGDDIGSLLRAVGKGEFPPPRSSEPATDRALEAVCLKAMATAPDNRYATPKALAEEIERWAADEPVAAYPEPFGRRARRWAGRYRTAVTSAAVALVAGLAGLGAIAAVQARANGALAAKNGELTRANAATARANAELIAANAKVEARYDLAVEAINTFHTGVSRDFLLKEDRFKDLRDRLLKSASDFYEKLGALLKGDSALPARRALLQANYQVAYLAFSVGRKEDALALHRRVLAGREALAAEPGASPAAAVDVARSLVAVGWALEDTGRTGEALAAYGRARAMVAPADGGPPEEAAARSAFADAEYRAGWLLQAVGRKAEALRALERARDIQQALVAADPADDDRQSALARSHHDIGVVLRATGKPAEALAALEAARAIQRKLAEADPAAEWYQFNLARTHLSIGVVLSDAGNPAEALASYERARAIQRKLAEANPAVTIFQNDLALSQYNIGYLLRDTGKPTEALAAYEAAREIQRRLAEANPAVTRFQGNLAESHNAIGNLLRATGKPTAALAALEAARAIRQKLAEANPAVTDFQSDLAASHHNIGELLRATGKPAEALAALEAARAIQQRVAEANPSTIQYQIYLANHNNAIGNLLRATGKPAEALAALEAARAIRQRLAEANPAVTDFQSDLAGSHHNIGLVLSATGKPAEALASYERARAIQQKLAEANPSTTQYQVYLANHQNAIGDVLSATGKPSEALAAHEAARAIRQRLADANQTITSYRDNLAVSHANAAYALGRLGRRDEARAGYEAAIALLEVLARDNPTTPWYRGSLARSWRLLGLNLLAGGNAADAASDTRRSLALFDSLPSRSGEEWFETACCHAALSGLAGRDGSGVSATEADAAMALLRKAVSMGYHTADAYRTEDALDPLRSRDDFRLLLLDLAMPADPFAAAR